MRKIWKMRKIKEKYEKNVKIRKNEIRVRSYFSLERFLEIWILGPENPSLLLSEGEPEKKLEKNEKNSKK